ncbi:MAG: hypothetical protein WAM82_17125 [Thermoanaerobaculia bacterium]
MTPDPQDDELLRSYLLGKLPEDDADKLERRLLADDDLFDLAEAVELDLLAAVDQGALPTADRELILSQLAASPRGRERLALARSLNDLAVEEARGSNVLAFFRRVAVSRQPAIRWMALAASLVLVAGLSWLAAMQGHLAPKEKSRIVQSPTPATQFHAPAPAPAAAPLPAKTPSASPVRTSAVSAVLAFSFSASRGAEARQTFKLAPGTHKVEIQIDADGLVPARSFDVVISRERDTILEKKGLAIGTLPWGRGLALDLPAELLPAGQYEIAVTPLGGEKNSQGFEVVLADKR